MKPLPLDAPLPSLFDRETMQTPARKIVGMVRSDSPIESQRGAADVLPKLTEIQALVMASITQYGPLNDRELESLPCFKGLAPSTARKRRSELVQQGRLVKVGRKDKLSTWDLPARAADRQEAAA